jgi:PKD repeat protein
MPQSCYEESFVPVEAKFFTEFKNADESVPVYIVIKNLSEGADTYEWEFEGGSPSFSSKKEPGEILYSQPGIYTIKLTVSNADGERDVCERKVDIKDAINISFSKKITQSDYPPVEVKFTNTTKGQNLTFQWTFKGGNPASFSGQNPPNVIFNSPGDHEVKLTVSNGFETLSKTDIVHVKENIVTAFNWETAHEDYDYQAPVKLFMNNQTQNAISYQWSFPGGSPSSSTETNPQVVYSAPGTYTITLTASNGKTTQKLQKQVTIQKDTGIYILKDVKLGVNYAHNTNTIGAFYSTRLRRSFTAAEVTSAVGADIDIAFQGQNNAFTYNKFVSPTTVNQYGFAAIPNAQQTLFINSQEICNCGLNFTEAQFDAVKDKTPLQNLNIPNSVAGQQQFGKQLPRIVLFKTQDGRKGAVKIKQFVAGILNQSYILCDIKVQK